MRIRLRSSWPRTPKQRLRQRKRWPGCGKSSSKSTTLCPSRNAVSENATPGRIYPPAGALFARLWAYGYRKDSRHEAHLRFFQKYLLYKSRRRPKLAGVARQDSYSDLSVSPSRHIKYIKKSTTLPFFC